MNSPLQELETYQLFEGARTHVSWQNQAIHDETIRSLYDKLKYGPTSHNCSPGRFIFLRSTESKERLLPSLNGSNVTKVITASLTVIIAYDLEFHEWLPELFPAFDAAKLYRNNPNNRKEAAFRNSSLQGAYLIMAARALGLDCGPMSGFDNELVDREFFPEGRWKSNFLCNLGYGVPEDLPLPKKRPEFSAVCKVL